MTAAFKKSARKAVATFIFATVGALIGQPLFDLDVATWKLAASTGIGAVLNLLFRWAEAAKDDV